MEGLRVVALLLLPAGGPARAEVTIELAQQRVQFHLQDVPLL